MSKPLPIVKLPHSPLRHIAKEVPLKEIKSSEIQELILNMKETLKNTPDGVGLAAPQVGSSLRIFLVSEEAEYVDEELKKDRDNSDDKLLDKNDEKNPPETAQKKNWRYFVYINPAVKKISRRTLEYPEGCLSVPGKFGAVKRSEKIKVEAYDETGKKFVRGASGFVSRVIQHEIDHLEGKIFIDTVNKLFSMEKNNGIGTN